MDTLVGFDSAWADNPKIPGAICAAGFHDGRFVGLEPPALVGFEDALAFIDRVRSRDGVTLIAIDQPTLVPNATGARPVERAAASLASWLGGGVQPASRSRTGLFCDDSPIWRFLSRLGATDDPEAARAASSGMFVMEVFPALSWPALDQRFFGRLCAPKYNPARRFKTPFNGKTFAAHWADVCDAAAVEAAGWAGGEALAEWCRRHARLEKPRKADQDRLDALLCLLVAARWRFGARDRSVMLGDLATGYMVLPASPGTLARLQEAARRTGVNLDGTLA